MSAEKDSVTIIDNRTGKQVELPLRIGTHGHRAIDVRSLHKALGYYTYDPGYMSTASCSSAITYIDGQQGILRYRGYPIEDLAQHSNYLEVCYLLLNGELPATEEFTKFTDNIKEFSLIHEGLRGFFGGFNRDAHPMATMVGVVGALSAFYPSASQIHNRDTRLRAAHRLIAKMPTVAAWSHKYSQGSRFVYPKRSLSYSENFLRMMFAIPEEEYEPNPLFTRALDLILILHADHEQNASTSTVRLTGSSEANPFAAISAGIASLWGPSHGGANEAVIRMLTEITNSGNLQKYVDKAKDKNDRFRLMGFGHRVYKSYDPRAAIIRDMCHELLNATGSSNLPIFETALKLEEMVSKDNYFQERNLYPNVDYYSGLILNAMGIPLPMFTVIFALARTVGWMSHWNEMWEDPESRIGRPRQLYIGEEKREFTPIDKR